MHTHTHAQTHTHTQTLGGCFPRRTGSIRDWSGSRLCSRHRVPRASNSAQLWRLHSKERGRVSGAGDTSGASLRYAVYLLYRYKAQILTLLLLLLTGRRQLLIIATGEQVTCFTGTKVQNTDTCGAADGVWDVLSDNRALEIAVELRGGAGPQDAAAACDAIVQEARVIWETREGADEMIDDISALVAYLT